MTVGGDEEEQHLQENQEEEKEPEEDNEATEEAKEEEVDEDEERRKEEEAATRIQAVFRGHHARKSMKETDSATKQEDNEPTKEELEAEFREDDKGIVYCAHICESLTIGIYNSPDGARYTDGSLFNISLTEECSREFFKLQLRPVVKSSRRRNARYIIPSASENLEI